MLDKDVLNEIQYHLLEDPNRGASIDSELWTIEQVIGYLNQSYRQFISNTRTNVSITNIHTTIGLSRYDLADFSDNILDISRLAFNKSATIGSLYFDLINDNQDPMPLPPRPYIGGHADYYYNRRRGWIDAETGFYNREYTFDGL